jgi:hypothetical protein
VDRCDGFEFVTLCGSHHVAHSQLHCGWFADDGGVVNECVPCILCVVSDDDSLAIAFETTTTCALVVFVLT